MSSIIADAVKKTRVELGLTTTTLAQHAGVPETELTEFERGNHALAASALTRLARAMGVPPTSFLTDAKAREVRSALTHARFFHPTDAPVLSEADTVALARELSRAQVFADLITPRVCLDEEYAPTRPGGRPWRNGYDLASSLRSKLGLAPTASIPNVQELLEDALGILVARHAFADRRLREVAVRAPRARLVVVSNRLSKSLLRISLAHGLCHHLCDLDVNDSLSEGDHSSPEGFSTADPGEEQRAKAFAVMFLAPLALVRDLFGEPAHQLVEPRRALSAASRLAAECGIGQTAALWHLFHLKYLSDRESDVESTQLRGSFVEPPSAFEQSFAGHDGLLRAIERALANEEIGPDQADWLKSL
jgi:transcriptional regulator with XRE-family HTH domain/Zn-dependent peptidase ImmA (M78 family)